MAKVTDTRHGGTLVQAYGSVASAGDHGAVIGNAEASTDAGLVIDVLRFAGAHAHLLDDFAHEVRHLHRVLAIEFDAGFLLHDLDAGAPLQGIVRVDERADPILELWNDLAAAVVRSRVGGKEDQHIDIELDRITSDLHIP